MPGPVLAISSQVAFAPVGNSAAVPALQASGLEVIALPTILLSNHPGLGTPEGMRTPAPTLAAMLEKLAGLHALDNLSAIMTGYFADAAQVHVVADMIRRLRPAFYLCDPVIGDAPHGLYVPQSVAEAIRDHLVPLAHAITPNHFERAWLGNIKARECITTGIPEAGQLVTQVEHADKIHRHASDRLEAVPHGTGDLLSGLYLAARLKAHEPAEAFARAMQSLDAAIIRSVGRSGLDLRGLVACA